MTTKVKIKVEQKHIPVVVEVLAAMSLADTLPRVVRDPQDVAAASDALYGAWLAGICLGTVGMALHHKLCHTLGGSFGLPHAELHTVVQDLFDEAQSAAGSPNPAR